VASIASTATLTSSATTDTAERKTSRVIGSNYTPGDGGGRDTSQT
jgi:hypothetical protein